MGTVFSVISSKFRRGAPRRRATTAAAHRASNRASDPPRSATSGSAQNFGKRSLLISRLAGRIALLRYTYPIQNRSTTVERTRRRHGWRMRGRNGGCGSGCRERMRERCIPCATRFVEYCDIFRAVLVLTARFTRPITTKAQPNTRQFVTPPPCA